MVRALGLQNGQRLSADTLDASSNIENGHYSQRHSLMQTRALALLFLRPVAHFEKTTLTCRQGSCPIALLRSSRLIEGLPSLNASSSKSEIVEMHEHLGDGLEVVLQRRIALGVSAFAIASFISLFFSRVGKVSDRRKGFDADFDDPVLSELRSQNELRFDRIQLEAEWKSLKRLPPDRNRTEAAFLEVLSFREEIAKAEQLARTRKVTEIDNLISLQLVHEFERAATVLASSRLLSLDARKAIGWSWGACGNKGCGAQADAAAALCKLLASLGMIVPSEALFYLDVAKRAIDEILQLGAQDGFVSVMSIPRNKYLSIDSLEAILGAEDLSTSPINIPIFKDGPSETDVSLEEQEQALLAEMRRQRQQPVQIVCCSAFQTLIQCFGLPTLAQS